MARSEDTEYRTRTDGPESGGQTRKTEPTDIAMWKSSPYTGRGRGPVRDSQTELSQQALQMVAALEPTRVSNTPEMAN